jgi:glycosyltransferase involved in cell wall biosynthesis
MQAKKKVLIIYIQRSSFVEQDIEALRVSNEVVEFDFGSNKGISMISAQLRLLFFLSLNVRRFDLVFCWFADYHCLIPSLFSSIFKYKYVIAIGGFDAAKIPEFNYGAHLNKIRSSIIKHAIKQADHLLCSSKFVLNTLIETTSFSAIKSKTTTVYPGISCSYPNENKTFPKNVLMIYVAAGDSINRMKIKGVDRFLELVSLNEEDQFILIGPSKDALAWINQFQLKNLEVITQIDRLALNEYYSRSQYIGLFSRFEAFGMVILEGMCNGCIPLVLKTNGSAEILEKPNAPGKVFDSFDSKVISNFLQTNKTTEVNQQAIQQYVRLNFPVDARAKELGSLFN